MFCAVSCPLSSLPPPPASPPHTPPMPTQPTPTPPFLLPPALPATHPTTTITPTHSCRVYFETTTKRWPQVHFRNSCAIHQSSRLGNHIAKKKKDIMCRAAVRNDKCDFDSKFLTHFAKTPCLRLRKRVDSSMLAAELASSLCCCGWWLPSSPYRGMGAPRQQHSLFGITYADRLRTSLCLAVALCVIGSAFRFDIVSSSCTDENKTERWLLVCRCGVMRFNNCVNCDHFSRENEPSVGMSAIC